MSDQVEEVETEEVEEIEEVEQVEEDEQPTGSDDDETEATEEAEDEADDADAPEADADTGEIVISFDDDDEGEDEDESSPIRQMRQSLRDKDKELKELRKKLEASQPEEPELGPKPKLEDFDYDADRFENALLHWNDQKRKADQRKQEAQEKADEQDKKYQARLSKYHERKAQLGVKNFDEIEDTVRESLPVDMQSVIVAYAEDPALMIYALGKNPDLIADLKQSNDLVEFGYRLSKMEAKMRVNPKTKPKPEKRAKSGGVAPPRSQEKQLDALRAKAAETGDFTEVNRFKQKMRRAT